ncbi:hypothetical protein BDN71DRAFT_1453915 [Pleurotus eryngii]|uniref:ATP synthase F(0) complex subunit e, mitochondrial n=1 Tax=Pleurotus eryngii TaxID=5323 RepID=A0A9P5ZMX7_PLEER|nr:hypothetical protein BDN71DRAFT_1453915 [Pleurotus eryngii]
MASPTVNVARYTALFTGVVYGWYHRRQLQADHDIQKQTHAVHERKILIAEAKEAYKKKLSVPKDSGVVTNPEDPRFDLEKLIAKWEAESS